MASDAPSYNDHIVQSSTAPSSVSAETTQRLQAEVHPGPSGRQGVCPNQVDPNSQQARVWADTSRRTEKDALQLNPDGTYTVNGHDCLSTVAVRLLHEEGKAVNARSIDHEVAHLRHLNEKNYNLEDPCVNLQQGWHLRVHGGGNHARPRPVEAEPPLPPVRPINGATAPAPGYAGPPQEVGQPAYVQPLPPPNQPAPLAGLAEGLLGVAGAIAGAALTPRYPGYWHGRHYERGWYPPGPGFGLTLDPNLYDQSGILPIPDANLVQYPYFQPTPPIYFGGGHWPHRRR